MTHSIPWVFVLISNEIGAPAFLQQIDQNKGHMVAMPPKVCFRR